MLLALTQFLTKHRHNIRLTIRFGVYFIAFFLLFSAFWINSHFGEPSLEQILYHLQFGMEGLVDTDAGIVHSFVEQCLYWPLGIGIFTGGNRTPARLFFNQSIKNLQNIYLYV